MPEEAVKKRSQPETWTAKIPDRTEGETPTLADLLRRFSTNPASASLKH